MGMGMGMGNRKSRHSTIGVPDASFAVVRIRGRLLPMVSPQIDLTVDFIAPLLPVSHTHYLCWCKLGKEFVTSTVISGGLFIALRNMHISVVFVERGKEGE